MTETTTAHWAKQICAAWQSSVRGIIKCGQKLIDAKDNLDHGKFIAMIENDLPFKKRTAQMLMSVAGDPRLKKANPGSLPASWRTLYELTRLDDAEFKRLLEDGTICPDMERGDIIKTSKPTFVTAVKTLEPKTINPVYVKNRTLRYPAIGYVGPSEKIKLMPPSEPATATRRQAHRVIDNLMPAIECPVEEDAVAVSAVIDLATGKQAHRVIESLLLVEELLADEATANAVVELLQTRGEEFFRVGSALQTLSNLKAAIDATMRAVS